MRQRRVRGRGEIRVEPTLSNTQYRVCAVIGRIVSAEADARLGRMQFTSQNRLLK
jgi:hypothetical protein